MFVLLERDVLALFPLFEREWAGLEWRASSWDIGAITGTLAVDDLATEEFPYVTFDGRFKGLWP